MIPGFERIVEERIRDAQRRGAFENLRGAGKPLAIDDDCHVPEDLRLAYKILKNSDCTPPEIELKKEIHCTEELLASMDDTTEKYRILKKLNLLIMKFNTLRQTSVRFELPQQYAANLAERFSAKACCKSAPSDLAMVEEQLLQR
jgi:hypothetical protein